MLNVTLYNYLVDYCGGHAVPYHMHERLSCYYEADATTSHSTRIGTALDGNGIYGMNINGGVPPTDLDACHGRTGVTPDSSGAEVYYYVITAEAPFTVGCFGPIDSLEACQALYDGCGDGDTETVTTSYGTDDYDLECPCYNSQGNNLGDGKPAYMPDDDADTGVTDAPDGDDTGTEAPKDVIKSPVC